MAYDAARDRVVMFGGRRTGPGLVVQAVFDETWEWDGSTWTQCFPRNFPSARFGHAMAYDSIQQRVVLFGGGGANPIWEWDGNNWVSRIPPNRPPSQAGHAMAFDGARGRVVMFANGQTWLWDRINWTTAGGRGPSNRMYHSMAFDPLRARVVLSGGLPSGSSVPSAETWEWDGSLWSQQFPPTSATGRHSHAMAFDSARGSVAVFGGASGPLLSQNLADTWHWDGSSWAQDNPATSPSARRWHAMVLHGSRSRLFLFGGYNGSNSIDDAWEYIQPHPASFAPYGSGCPGSAGTPTLSAVGTELPWIGTTFAMRLDNIGAHPLFNVPFVLVGFSRTAWGTLSLPFDLSPHGMPGCSLLAEPALAFTLGNQGGSATWTLTLPNDPHIAGASLFVQGGVTDLAANSAGLVFSNAGEVAIGAR